VCDAPTPQRGRLRWELRHLDGRVLGRGRQAVTLQPGASVKQRTLDLAAPLAQYGRDTLYLRIALDLAGGCVSEDTVLFAPPRFLALPQAHTAVAIHLDAPRRATLTFISPVFQHRFAFDLPGIAHHSSDNYFELYPGEEKSVTVEFEQPQTPARLRRRLTHRSLVDTY
jgi:beta-mannosidase